ncbi:MAG TPA: AtpZ/AtpI family protein [Syntrophomonadaceae bacterium]|nr:AtpZ/AtpI family protein [Syntrophomonadaceae bacterium]
MSERNSKNWAKALADAMNLVTTIAAAVGGCGWIGYWLDHRYHTDPWLTLVGGLIGIATAIKMMWDRANKN